MASLPTFCFVIPCFNEEDNVGATVGAVREAMGSRGDYEIVLVNDASTDRTLELMQALAAVDPRIRVLDNPSNLGFGGSYKRGARAATATYVMMLPGDDGFPAQSIAEIVSHAGEADIIIPVVTNPGARTWIGHNWNDDVRLTGMGDDLRNALGWKAVVTGKHHDIGRCCGPGAAFVGAAKSEIGR